MGASIGTEASSGIYDVPTKNMSMLSASGTSYR